MKNFKKTLAIIMIVLGVILFLVGALYRLLSWEDIFYGLYSGPLLFVLGIVFLMSIKKTEV